MIHDQFNQQLEEGKFVTLSKVPKDLAFGITVKKLTFLENLLNKPLLISDTNEGTEANLELEYTEDNQHFQWIWVNSHDVALISS